MGDGPQNYLLEIPNISSGSFTILEQTPSEPGGLCYFTTNVFIKAFNLRVTPMGLALAMYLGWEPFCQPCVSMSTHLTPQCLFTL